ncbi:hypothetical protein ACIFOT_08695 [Neobacillus sp. NRS-1170]
MSSVIRQLICYLLIGDRYRPIKAAYPLIEWRYPLIDLLFADWRPLSAN